MSLSSRSACHSIRVRAVALSPLPTGTAIFGGLLGKKALISPELLVEIEAEAILQ